MPQQLTSAESFRSLFENWPPSMKKEGMVVTTLGEVIPFVNYLVSPGIVILERDKPDTYGTRKVMLSWEAISSVKSTNPADLAVFSEFGFQTPQ